MPNVLQKLCEGTLSLRPGSPLETFAELSRMIGEALGVSAVCLSEFDGERLTCLARWADGQVDVEPEGCALGQGPCAAVACGKVLKVYERVSREFPEASFLQARGAESYCGVPSLDAAGEVVAVTSILDDRPLAFAREERLGLRLAAQRIGTEIERLRVERRRRQSEDEAALAKRALRVLSKSSQAKLRAWGEVDLCQRVCEIIVGEGGYALAWIGFAESDEAKSVRPIAQAGFEEGYLQTIDVTWADSERGQGPTGKAIRSRAPSLAQDILNDPAFAPWREAALARGYASSIALPLGASDSRRPPLGALNVYAREPNAFGAIETQYLITLTQELSAGVEALRREGHRVPLEVAIEQAAEAIVVTDTAGLISYVNPAFERSTGYSRGEAIGRHTRTLGSGRQSRELFAELWQTITSGRTWSGRFENQRKDGSLYTEDATISPVRYPQTGEIAGYVAVKRDVTRELELEQQLRQAQKLEAVGRLAAGVAHDFNNLLTVILGYSSLLEGAGESSVAEKITSAAERGAELTSQLLVLSRQAAAKPRTLDMNAAVAEALGLLERVIGEGVELLWSPTKALAPVWADAGHIQQVVVNLVVNARDAMPDGGRVTLETRRAVIAPSDARGDALPAGEYTVLSVSDTGHGLNAETQARIFDPFFTTKGTGGGTGLGLATVLGIAQQSKGHVFVESAPGAGARFEVYLPACEESLPSDAEPAARMASSLTGSETLLLVEDQPEVRRLLEATLVGAGYEVLSAAQPAAALETWAAAGSRIQLLVTDVVMPGMNGDELADRLKSEDEDLSVLFLSGYTPDPSFAARLSDPGVGYLGKPFAPKALLGKVRQLLRRSGG